MSNQIYLLVELKERWFCATKLLKNNRTHRLHAPSNFLKDMPFAYLDPERLYRWECIIRRGALIEGPHPVIGSGFCHERHLEIYFCRLSHDMAAIMTIFPAIIIEPLHRNSRFVSCRVNVYPRSHILHFLRFVELDNPEWLWWLINAWNKGTILSNK